VTALMAMPATFDEHETRVRAKRMGRAIEARMLQLGMTQLFHAGGYVDPADVRSLPVSARDIEHLIKHSLDLEEAAKPSLMAGVRAARREPVGD
jgi:hypothetical protein